MKVKVLAQSDDTMKLLLDGTEPAFANALRRVLVADVPKMAIEDVEFHLGPIRSEDGKEYESIAPLFDEIIAHRLGLVPLPTDLDLYNPKAVRASAGSLFHVPVVDGGDPVEVLGRLGEWGVQRLGAVAGRGSDYTAVDLVGPIALVLGNEASGIPDPVAACLDGEITIPMTGRAESLNVGMAAAVLCFEAARQRRARRAMAGAT